MATLPSDFEEAPVVYSKEAIRISRQFQKEPHLQKDACMKTYGAVVIYGLGC